MGSKFIVYTDAKGEWRWKLVHANGNILADSGEGYTQKHSIMETLENLKQNIFFADIEELD
jgi:uncharacterized protein YegP (UPF0339 family)